jgi:hypothetical protein
MKYYYIIVVDFYGEKRSLGNGKYIYIFSNKEHAEEKLRDIKKFTIYKNPYISLVNVTQDLEATELYNMNQ